MDKSNNSDEVNCKPARHSAGRVILLIILALVAGMVGAVLVSFYLFPALAGVPYFQKYLSLNKDGQAIVKLVEKEREIVSEDSVFYDAINANLSSIVTVVAKNPGNKMLPEVSGTGFIVSADGLIVTNKHFVLDKGAIVKVITADYNVSEAEVVARDPLNDLALLKIKGDNLQVANLYPDEEIKLGQRVLALGSKYGRHDNFASFGILSGINSGVLVDTQLAVTNLEGILQTDAVVDSQDSGGPLVDLNGAVIGLNSDAGSTDIGLAIPVSLVRSAIDSYLENGTIVRSTLGVNWQTVTPGVAQIAGYDRWEGALIVSSDDTPAVTPGGPAAQAGLQRGDIIHKINGEAIDLDNGFMRMLQEYEPGTDVEITYIRNNEEKTVSIKVGELK